MAGVLLLPAGLNPVTAGGRPVADAEAASAAQQDNIVRGTVLDERGETLVGVSVIIQGTSTGTATDAKGRFEIRAKRGDVLVVSSIGFITENVTVTGNTLTVTLKEDSQMLGEVVVTALGLPKQARQVGYATTRVSTDEIERTNTINPVNALQGKVAGLQINTGGASGVTSSSSITIRGANSVDKNNSPIFVIDGLIIQEPITGNLAGTDWGSQLKNLNPADYESVTVLKGAAATALYGSRGANGAIVIVSKGGKYSKQGLGVEVNQTVEVTDVYKSPVELQNIYGAGYTYNGYQSDFQPDGSLDRVVVSWGPRMDGREINQYMPDGKNTPFSPHPMNWKEFYQTGINNTTNVAISGGGEKSSFRLSYGFTKTKGVFLNNDFHRHNISFRGNTQLNNVFSMELGVKYAFSSAKNGASQGGWDWGNNVGMITAYYLPRNVDIAAYYKQYRDPETQAVESTSRYGTLRSYFHTRDTQLQRRNENSILSDLTIHADIAPWLRASLKANHNYYGISHESRWVGTGEYGGPSGSGGYGRSGDISGNYNFMGMLQMPEQTLKLGGEVFTVAAIAAAELYGNTEGHSWGKQTNGGIIGNNNMPARAIEGQDFYINQEKMHTFTPLITYPETCLMLAEIAVKKGGSVAGKDAKGWFREGVKASMEQYRDWATDMFVVAQTAETAPNYSPITDAKINEYLARPEFSDITLEKIISQQWVNLYMNPEEMWATWKRTGLPAFKAKPEPEGGVAFLEEIKDAKNVLTIPRRNSLGTPNTLNIGNFNAAIDALKRDAKYGSDNDRTEGRIWWDVE